MLEEIDETKCTNGALVKPFIVTNCELLESEYNIKISNISFNSIGESITINDINFITTLNGAMSANLIFSFSKELAKGVLDNFSFIEYDESNFEELLMEVVSEYLNIIVGRAMKYLDSKQSLIFTPPIELSGESKLFHSNDFDICKVDIETNHNNLSIIFSTQSKKG